MFCPHCGAQIKVRSELFCAKCGKPTAVALTAGVQPTHRVNTKALVPSGPINLAGWLLIVMLAMLYLGVGLSIMDRTKVSANQLGGVAIWTGTTLAYFWRRQGRSGFLGFGLGLVLAIALFVGSSFLAAFLQGVENRVSNTPSSGEISNTLFDPIAYGSLVKHHNHDHALFNPNRRISYRSHSCEFKYKASRPHV